MKPLKYSVCKHPSMVNIRVYFRGAGANITGALGGPRDAQFKFLMGGIAQNFEIDGGQCPPSLNLT